jgi:hypothetical protein
MERWFMKEDSNGMKDIGVRSADALSLNGKQCLPELKLMLNTLVIKQRLNSHAHLMKHQTMNHLV